MIKIIENLLVNNDCYNDGRMLSSIKGIMLHSVGCAQPSAMAFINNWNRPGVGACVHGFIQADGAIYKTLPLNKRGWHAGGTANSTHLGFEMTEPSTIKYTGNGSEWTTNDMDSVKDHVIGTYNAAVELFAQLCKEFNLDPLADGVIISHSEGYKRGIACNHGDVEHIWNKFGLTMNQFRLDIKKEMDKINSSETVVEQEPIVSYPDLTGDQYYRVASDYQNGKYIGQVGAYHKYTSAVTISKSSSKNVYDPCGVKIYPAELKQDIPTVNEYPDLTGDQYYRVASDYQNGKYIGQVGAYRKYASAVNIANANSLKVFSPTGDVLYTTSEKITYPDLTGDDFYRVATNYINGKYVGQIGAYRKYDSALRVAKDNGLKLFGPTGTRLY